MQIWQIVNDKVVRNKQNQENFTFDSVFTSELTNEKIF